ncbi:MAG: hypothetical protein R2704_09925 [Microthrixaceae bacterium]
MRLSCGAHRPSENQDLHGLRHGAALSQAPADANFGGLADARCVDQVGYGSAVEVIDLGDGETYQRRARILFTRAGPGWSIHQYTRDGDGCRDLDLTDEQHDHLCPPD